MTYIKDFTKSKHDPYDEVVCKECGRLYLKRKDDKSKSNLCFDCIKED